MIFFLREGDFEMVTMIKVQKILQKRLEYKQKKREKNQTPEKHKS